MHRHDSKIHKKEDISILMSDITAKVEKGKVDGCVEEYGLGGE